ncbi:XRE family transcriptional regulator [Weissella paramesenteroides]|uniref:HTH cro/C1-type domain-containing protein n=1 Tax=Weissella paramesenteroides ATCC 33313 TaxID=585506 RepID=C5R858_WEIPA|nr:helix-turn-helix transcriptional regulator [Weissella paramesenteroides]EER75642.1 hypothetical protein HMPREF0877_0153 [Weissella paramesenteroides ATCC 33313]TOY71527.1 XRE family transcriptional regulator [Weissella paramesenteroides]
MNSVKDFDLKERIKILAEQQGKSLADITKESGYTSGRIGNWSQFFPGMAQVEHIASLLDVSILDLLPYTAEDLGIDTIPETTPKGVLMTTVNKSNLTDSQYIILVDLIKSMEEG